MSKDIDKIKVFTCPNGRATVSKLELSEEEYERRHKEFERATVVYMREVYRVQDERAAEL